jgi:hypothetical protein
MTNLAHDAHAFKNGSPSRRVENPRAGIPRYAIQDRVYTSDLPRTAQILAIKILELAAYGDNPRGCFKSDEAFGLELRTTPRQVFNLVQLLIREGWARVERSGESKFGRRTLYPGPKCFGVGADPEVHLEMHLEIQGAAPRSAPGNPISTETEEKEREREFAGGMCAPLPEQNPDGGIALPPGWRVVRWEPADEPAAEPLQASQDAPGAISGPPDVESPTAPAPKPAQRYPHPPTRREPTMQNHNPRQPAPPPDDNPAETARVIAAMRARFPAPNGG